MTDLPILSTVNPAESIPAALAAPRAKKNRSSVKATGVVAPIAPTLSDEVTPVVDVNPPAAVSAEIATEEPIMATTIENITETATDKTQAFTADMGARAKDAMDKGSKLFADMNGFTKGNVEALVESSRIAVAGVQTLAQGQAAYVRKQFEDATAAARTLAGVKSPTDFVKLQGDYVRQQFDGAIAEMSRSTEVMMKLAGEVVQPISNRIAVAVEKVKMAA